MISSRIRLRGRGLVLAIVMWSAQVLGIHEGDVELRVADGRLATHPGRVFAGRLGLDLTGNGEIDLWTGVAGDPGFDSERGTFPASSSVTFNILAPLLLWDGSGYEGIDSGGPTMRVEFLSLFAETADGHVPGFSLGVDSQGAFHKHYNFALVDNGEGIPAGIYLIELEMTSSDAAIGPSHPFWIVWNYAMDDATHEAAILWAEAHLAVSAPFMLTGIQRVAHDTVRLTWQGRDSGITILQADAPGASEWTPVASEVAGLERDVPLPDAATAVYRLEANPGG